jgi:hypothetical protein
MILLTLLLQAAPAPAPASPPAPWVPRERANAGGGSSLTASTTASDGSSRLVVKCDRGAEPVVSVQFIAKQPLQVAGDDGSYPDKVVALRFDNGPAIGYTWQLRGNAAYDAAPADVTALTMFLVKAKSVRVETTNGAGFAFNATFAAPPSDAPVRQVLSACGYTLGTVPAPLAKPK